MAERDAPLLKHARNILTGLKALRLTVSNRASQGQNLHLGASFGQLRTSAIPRFATAVLARTQVRRFVAQEMAVRPAKVCFASIQNQSFMSSPGAIGVVLASTVLKPHGGTS
jgi:hypothetical protein